jgi:hypothetical protein
MHYILPELPRNTFQNWHWHSWSVIRTCKTAIFDLSSTLPVNCCYVISRQFLANWRMHKTCKRVCIQIHCWISGFTDLFDGHVPVCQELLRNDLGKLVHAHQGGVYSDSLLGFGIYRPLRRACASLPRTIEKSSWQTGACTSRGCVFRFTAGLQDLPTSSTGMRQFA